MRLVALLMASVIAVAGCTPDDPALDPDASPTVEDDGDVEGSPEPDGDGEVVELVLTAELDAAAVVPGPGDTGGVGAFRGVVQPMDAGGQLCFDLQVSGLSSAVAAAHIHVGAADEAGPVVVGLPGATDGEVSDCVDLGTPDYERLVDPDANLYVNVHTQDHPDGAVRGQLTS
jgi:hypothetical protein